MYLNCIPTYILYYICMIGCIIIIIIEITLNLYWKPLVTVYQDHQIGLLVIAYL